MPIPDNNVNVRHRRSLRLNGYDYAQAGAYFVTMCTRNRECAFGRVDDGEMRLNDAGRTVRSIWQALPDRFSGIELDAFVVMPNHIHGIATFVGAGLALPGDKGAASSAPASGDGVAHGVPTLADVIRAFKSLSAIHVNRLLRRSGSVWQRSYFDHVVRDDRDLDRIREYIVTNPLKWTLDRENPQRTGASPEEDELFDPHPAS